MTTIIGVRFRTAGKVYYFDPGEHEPKRDSHVIVETAQGMEYGTVVLPRKEVEDERIKPPLKQILRMATPEDDEQEAQNRSKEKEAMQKCRELIRKRGIDMKLTGCEYTFDRNKLLFYFTADGRVDFRELVKDLASAFHTRIELRQIGVRDETKITGGIGICGRELCCATFLSEFSPVSIKMAKEQNLSLNPTKISGMCGRLMCCLSHEEEAYEALNAKLPRNGDTVTTPDGLKGQVTNVNVLRGRVRVLVQLDEDGEEKEMRDYSADELDFKPRRKKGKQQSGKGAGEGEQKNKEGKKNQKKKGDHPGKGDQKEKSEQRGGGQHKPKGDHGDHSERPEGRGAAAGGEGAAGEEHKKRRRRRRRHRSEHKEDGSRQGQQTPTEGKE